MQSVHTSVEQDRRHWHLDKTLNVSHLLTTVVIAGSLFAYANNMDRRVAILVQPLVDERLEVFFSDRAYSHFTRRKKEVEGAAASITAVGQPVPRIPSLMRVVRRARARDRRVITVPMGTPRTCAASAIRSQLTRPTSSAN